MAAGSINSNDGDMDLLPQPPMMDSSTTKLEDEEGGGLSGKEWVQDAPFADVGVDDDVGDEVNDAVMDIPINYRSLREFINQDEDQLCRSRKLHKIRQKLRNHKNPVS